MPSQDSPLSPICKSWLAKIEQAIKHKRPFQEDAKEAMSFYDGENNFMWRDEYARGERGYNKGIAPPEFRMTINRVWEAVRLFGAVIYHRNPARNVTPRALPKIPPEAVGIVPRPPVPQMGPDGQPRMGPDGQPIMMPDPQIMQYQQALQNQAMQQQKREITSRLLEDYLNYTPNELDLKGHSKRVVDQALIIGAGVWWTELVHPDGGNTKIAGSFYDNFDNLVWDPDADEFQDILWCARRCVHPIDQVAEEYGVPREDLAGCIESYGSRAESGDPSYKHKKRNGKTNDLVAYWKVWSKTGFGDRLKDAPKDMRGKFDALGKNCYIVVADGLSYPLNIPPSILQEEVDETGVPPSLFKQTQWPIPFWAEPQGWPFTLLQWHSKPGYSYPTGILRAGIGELRFINWAMSFLATRIATSSQTLIGVSKAADPDIKAKILERAEGGFKIVEISEAIGRNVNDVISVFSLPGVTADMFQIVAQVTELFDRRVGLTELIYGMSRNQFRSAAEANVKSEQISVRPDDMANQLEDALSAVARKEALLARWMIGPEDVAQLLGDLGAQAWQMNVQQEQPDAIVREYTYRVEAGSARKPNKGTKVEQINNAMQILMPMAQGLMQQGNPQLINALLEDWGRALDMDVSRYVIQPPPPPPPPPPPQQQGPPQQGGPPQQQQGPPQQGGPPQQQQGPPQQGGPPQQQGPPNG